MNIKEFLSKSKGIAIFFIVAVILGFGGGRGDISQGEYEALLAKKESLDNEVIAIDSSIRNIETKVNDLLAEKEAKEKVAKEEAQKRYEPCSKCY